MAKRLQDLVKDTSKEEGPESKRRRTGNLDYQELEMMESNVDKNYKRPISLSLEPQNAGKQQIFQEKQQLIKDLEALRASQLKLQAQIAEKEDQLKELTGPLLETELPDEILLKIFGVKL